MSVFSEIQTGSPPAPVLGDPLARFLVDVGKLTLADAIAAEKIANESNQRVADILFHRFAIAPLTIADAYTTLYQTSLIDPCKSPPHRSLVMQLGPCRAIQSGLLPWREMGGDTVVLTDKPDQFEAHSDLLANTFARVRMGITTRAHIEAAVTSACAGDMAAFAETKAPSAQSCRTWNAKRTLTHGSGFLIALLICMVITPFWTFNALCICAIMLLALNTALKIAAAIASQRADSASDAVENEAGILPKITLLVPLFRETAITDHLLIRLQEIDYPRELMDVCLVTESDDATTRKALGKATLPTWMRPIIVPQGTLRTKPRALNFALDFAQGSIIGVYDAEDAPAPDQLRVVAARFANRGPEVACLQGVLDYYNDKTNWLTRCFTVEYATWFRIVLPGLAKMGLVVPLGGTTLFFRRNVLEALGGWDAHNVTEDADLGVRLARAGYRTELINTVTQEEANGRFWPWVKQRSRWLKGYAITYAVHMRAPRKLWRELGPKRFWGVQLLFAGTLSQFVLAPLLWSFWLIPFGFAHPFLTILSPLGFWTLVSVFFFAEIANFLISAIALRIAGKTWLIKWAITLQFYFPLAAIAAYKGLIELAWKPFYWDKTMHGVLLPTDAIRPPQPPPHQS